MKLQCLLRSNCLRVKQFNMEGCENSLGCHRLQIYISPQIIERMMFFECFLKFRIYLLLPPNVVLEKSWRSMISRGAVMRVGPRNCVVSTGCHSRTSCDPIQYYILNRDPGCPWMASLSRVWTVVLDYFILQKCMLACLNHVHISRGFIAVATPCQIWKNPVTFNR